MTVEIPYVYIIATAGIASCMAAGAIIGIIVTLLRDR